MREVMGGMNWRNPAVPATRHPNALRNVLYLNTGWVEGAILGCWDVGPSCAWERILVMFLIPYVVLVFVLLMVFLAVVLAKYLKSCRDGMSRLRTSCLEMGEEMFDSVLESWGTGSQPGVFQKGETGGQLEVTQELPGGHPGVTQELLNHKIDVS